MSVRPATLVALLFAALALAFAGCGGDDNDASSSEEPTAAATETATQDGEDGEEREREEAEAREAGGKDCSTVGDIDGEPSKQPPEDVVVLQGAHVYESEGPFGKTERFLAVVDGQAADLPARRDEAAQALEGVGFKTLSTDQEENTEAEAHMQGDKHTVDIQVISLCEGKLRIRYTVS
jgi:ABC-type Fe3+-hydroxamate transport system substrate-binding protein